MKPTRKEKKVKGYVYLVCGKPYVSPIDGITYQVFPTRDSLEKYYHGAKATSCTISFTTPKKP